MLLMMMRELNDKTINTLAPSHMRSHEEESSLKIVCDAVLHQSRRLSHSRKSQLRHSFYGDALPTHQLWV